MSSPQTPARALATFRILTGVVVLGSADVWRAPLLIEAGTPAEVLRATALAAAAVMVLGYRTRAASVVVTAALGVLFGLLQQQGTPIHIHHLVWLCGLLAASPAGAAWSLDARGRTPDASTLASCELALRWACVVLALVYFFPGVHKVVDEGSPFGDASSLSRLVRLKALESGAPVILGLDDSPRLLHVGAVAVVAAELLLIVVALWRPRVGFSLVVFIHASIAIAMRMPYTVLWIFAVVFLLPVSRGVGVFSSWRPVSAVGALLVVGVTWAGARADIHGYPFACYPTFATPVPERIPVLFVRTVGATTRTLPHDVVIPDEMRTPITFAARRVTTAAQAERFVRWRMQDRRFAEAVAGASRLRVDVVLRDLREPPAEDSTVLSADVSLP